jgi:TRAP-type C4-dicarboxylate transport system substrate-binding protein
MHINEDSAESSEPNAQFIFARRTAASKEVYKELSAEERAVVDERAENAEREPTAPEVQKK